MSDETPTPETHHYVGMWRPPFEQARDESRPTQYGAGWYNCSCGIVDSSRELREHWLAGHFDVPQYEPKIRDTREERSRKVFSLWQEGRISLDERERTITAIRAEPFPDQSPHPVEQIP